MAREPRGEGGGRPRLLTVYLDPPTGRVLDVMEFRAFADRLPAPLP